MRMTQQELDDLNRARLARGHKPLTETGHPITPAIMRLALEKVLTPPTLNPKLVKVPRGTSHLEEKFVRLWEYCRGPKLEREFKFHPVRKWRADFVDHATRTLIEVEGGAHRGRHTSVSGFFKDAEKYLEAWHCGYTVLRITSPQLKTATIARIVARLTK